LCLLLPHFYGEFGAEALGTQRDDRRRASKFFAALPAWNYQDDHRETRNSAGNSVRISGGKSVTRYSRVSEVCSEPYPAQVQWL